MGNCMYKHNDITKTNNIMDQTSYHDRPYDEQVEEIMHNETEKNMGTTQRKG